VTIPADDPGDIGAYLARLRREMAGAHPDRGGTSEGFIAARTRYQRAVAALRPRDDSTTAERAIAGYDLMEAVLQEIIDTPHWRVRNGNLVLGDDGQPVPDTRPARQARARLTRIRANRERLAERGKP
jgi:hypothetical protein